MKVLFIVQGEGRGHLTQALTLEKMLEDAGHQVVGMLVGKSKNREIPQFFYEKAHSEIIPFYSPNFVAAKDKCHVGHVSSAVFNFIRIPEYMAGIHKIYDTIRRTEADIVVNFYEVLCGLTYTLLHPSAPEVCIGHQYLFLHPDFKFPNAHAYSQKWLRLFTRMTCLGATRILALSFRDYKDNPASGITVVPPLLRNEIIDTPRHHGNYITGYVLNPGFAESVMRWHESHKNVKLCFFWDKKDADAKTVIDDNLTFYRINDEAFIHSLADCRAYATTGGFESVCEALYMGKPVMMVPAHIEQECNTYDAEQQGAGISAESFDEIDKLIDFSKDYDEDVDFRMWENSASSRIIANIENVYNQIPLAGSEISVGNSLIANI